MIPLFFVMDFPTNDDAFVLTSFRSHTPLVIVSYCSPGRVVISQLVSTQSHGPPQTHQYKQVNRHTLYSLALLSQNTPLPFSLPHCAKVKTEVYFKNISPWTLSSSTLGLLQPLRIIPYAQETPQSGHSRLVVAALIAIILPLAGYRLIVLSTRPL